MLISDWRSDVCSSDLRHLRADWIEKSHRDLLFAVGRHRSHANIIWPAAHLGGKRTVLGNAGFHGIDARAIFHHRTHPVVLVDRSAMAALQLSQVTEENV